MKRLFVSLSIIVLLYACSKSDSESPRSEPVYTENFSEGEGTGFWTGSRVKDSFTAAIQDGFYQVTNKGSQLHTFSINPVFIVDTGNVALETKVAASPLDGNGLCYAGLIWGVNHDNGQVFIFGYLPKGYFNVLGAPKGGEFKVYKGNTPSPAIKKAGFNRLRIERKNGSLHFLINGTEVFKMATQTSSLDRPGFIVDKKTKAQFDYFKASALP